MGNIFMKLRYPHEAGGSSTGRAGKAQNYCPCVGLLVGIMPEIDTDTVKAHFDGVVKCRDYLSGARHMYKVG